ncbi:hypothetical protein KDAU_26090 [Dictyobacter aurantiacus]|uniref:Uncharacterized protein n=1 Tax=Dictyobacter aurantiacus TaxID=1936993 RepID=A0A401ZEH4_9CHLR|nr:hypothetical protein KDAU_26090 [Dictyobacter aurantiacus]
MAHIVANNAQKLSWMRSTLLIHSISTYTYGKTSEAFPDFTLALRRGEKILYVKSKKRIKKS